MTDLDNVLDLIISDNEVSFPSEWMESNHIQAHRRINHKTKSYRPRWTVEEEKFLHDNLADLSINQIASILGRTEGAIRIRATRRGFQRPRHASEYLSTNKIAHLLGVDSHKPPTWFDLGILEGEAYPYKGQLKRRVKWVTFKRFLIRPQSWVYFDVKRVKNKGLRRLVEMAQEKWGDEWLTTRQAADMKDCEVQDIARMIKLGRLYGYHAIGLDRIRNPKWAYWFVRKSDIEKLVIPRRGQSVFRFWGEEGDDFIIRARCERKQFQEISRMMKQPMKRIQNRYWHIYIHTKRKIN